MDESNAEQAARVRAMAAFDALPEWARWLAHEHGATMVKQAMGMVGRDEARVTRLIEAERRKKQSRRYVRRPRA